MNILYNMTAIICFNGIIDLTEKETDATADLQN